MLAYYAMGYLSRVLFSITTIGEHPHVKTPNAHASAAAGSVGGAEAGGSRLQAIVRPRLWQGRPPRIVLSSAGCVSSCFASSTGITGPSG